MTTMMQEHAQPPACESDDLESQKGASGDTDNAGITTTTCPLTTIMQEHAQPPACESEDLESQDGASGDTDNAGVTTTTCSICLENLGTLRGKVSSSPLQVQHLVINSQVQRISKKHQKVIMWMRLYLAHARTYFIGNVL